MKKIILNLLVLALLSSCLQNKAPMQELKLLPIDAITAPAHFTLNQVDTIAVSYTLPNGCHFYHSLYYQYEGPTRIVAIRAIHNLETMCTEATQLKELKIPVLASQTEDYLFKFWKGKNNNGEDIFEEITINVK